MGKELDLLREENLRKDKELSDLRTGIKIAMQGPNQASSHLQNLLEQQSQELCRLRRLAEEYEKREKAC